MACQASLSGRGVLQATILECIGQYWLPYLLEHCFLLPEPPAPLRTWCCQNPCDPSSCTASAPGPQGANPSPPGQPQEQTPGDGPHAEVGIKTQVKPRGGAAKEEDPKPPHQLYKLQVKSPRSTRQTLHLWEIQKGTEAPPGENAPVLTAEDLEASTHRSGARLDPSCPLSRSRDQHSVGHPREARRTVTPSEGKDSFPQEKHLLLLYFDLFCRFFWISFSFSFPRS